MRQPLSCLNGDRMEPRVAPPPLPVWSRTVGPVGPELGLIVGGWENEDIEAITPWVPDCCHWHFSLGTFRLIWSQLLAKKQRQQRIFWGKPVAVPATHRQNWHVLGAKNSSKSRGTACFGSSSCRSYVVQTPPVPLKSVEGSGCWGYHRLWRQMRETPQLGFFSWVELIMFSTMRFRLRINIVFQNGCFTTKIFLSVVGWISWLSWLSWFIDL